MAVLHVVNSTRALDSCLEVVAQGDVILLIEDGVYAGVVAKRRPMLALRDDAAARGLLERMAPGVGLVGYDGFVDLVVTHQPVVSWR